MQTPTDSFKFSYKILTKCEPILYKNSFKKNKKNDGNGMKQSDIGTCNQVGLESIWNY